MANPLPFNKADGIPILGQICTPLGCTHIVPMRCNCEAQSFLQIEGVNARRDVPRLPSRL